MADFFFRRVAALTAASCLWMTVPPLGLTVGPFGVTGPSLHSGDSIAEAVVAPPVRNEVGFRPVGDNDRVREQKWHHVERVSRSTRHVPDVPVNRPLRPIKRSMLSHGVESNMPTWSPEQLANARTIASVGRSLGASQRDILIGIMTAMQESGLRNLNYGDRDSVGLFQQRTPWGALSQRMDPKESARMFFQGGHGGQRGLFAFSNRDSMSLGQAAQKVQVSAFPGRYATHETEARDILGNLGELNSSVLQGQGTQGVVAQTGPDQVVQQNGDLNLFAAAGVNSPDAGVATAAGIASPGAPGTESADMMPDMSSVIGMFDGMDATTPSGGSTFQEMFPKQGTVGGARERVGQLGRQLLGTPYVWGGTDPQKGLDCSGFVQYVLRQVGVQLPRISSQQANAGRRVGLNQLKAGDLVAWDNSSRNNGADHIAIYLGNGQIIEAPRPGIGVRIRSVDKNEGAWGVSLNY